MARRGLIGIERDMKSRAREVKVVRHEAFGRGAERQK
jgi:hypothetical protein